MNGDPREATASLLTEQRLAVLSTSLQGHPYTTLVAFAPSPDLRLIFFATPRSTRKFANLHTDTRVSLLVDNRSNRADDFRTAMAVTALGRAVELDGEELPVARGLYLARHPYLRGFVEAPTCALFAVEVRRYSLVRRFQDVSEWTPSP